MGSSSKNSSLDKFLSAVVKSSASGEDDKIIQGSSSQKCEELKVSFKPTKKKLVKQNMIQDQEELKIVEEGDKENSWEWESVSNISDVDEEDAGDIIEQMQVSNSSLVQKSKLAARIFLHGKGVHHPEQPAID